MLQYNVLEHKIETKVILDDLLQHASKLILLKKRKWRRYIYSVSYDLFKIVSVPFVTYMEPWMHERFQTKRNESNKIRASYHKNNFSWVSLMIYVKREVCIAFMQRVVNIYIFHDTRVWSQWNFKTNTLACSCAFSIHNCKQKHYNY